MGGSESESFAAGGQRPPAKSLKKPFHRSESKNRYNILELQLVQGPATGKFTAFICSHISRVYAKDYRLFVLFQKLHSFFDIVI